MYQAIVFLPLIGAILAGIIAIYGARKRFPGHEASSDHHAPATHGHAAHVAGDHAVIHHATHEPHGQDDHHAPAEPAAEGSRAAEIITTSLLFVSCVLAWIAFWRVGFGHGDERVALFDWIVSG